MSTNESNSVPRAAELHEKAIGSGDVVVGRGDCMSSIGARSGHSWQKLWDLPENAELKEVRGNPNALLVGDRVHVPPLDNGDVDCATEKRHRFRRRGVPAPLRIQCLIRGEPVRDEPFHLIVDGESIEGTTDGDGMLEVFVPPHAQSAVLRVGEDLEYDLLVGYLDPVDTVSGVQGRLSNLGLYAAGVDGKLGPKTQRALRRFQESRDLEVTGELDQATIDGVQALSEGAA